MSAVYRIIGNPAIDPAEWATGKQAAHILGVAYMTLHRRDHKQHPGSAGWLWLKADIERVARIRACGISLTAALKVAAALKRGDLP